MRIKGLRITNFARFRGDHEMDLSAGVHAIVAALGTDPNRSNWLGKTSLLTAIRWALFGELTDAWKTVDSAISDGEKSMGVDVELTDGTFVSRTKLRGQSAQLKVIVNTPNGEKMLAQDVAQAEVCRRLGSTLKDFDATVWMGQKSMARLLRMDPAERTTVVNDWFGLQKLVVAAEIVARKYTETDRRYFEERTKLGLASDAAVGDREQLVRSVLDARLKVQQAKLKISENQRARLAHDKWETLAALVKRRDRAATEAEAIEAEQPKVVTVDSVNVARTMVETCRADLAAALKERKRLEELARGQFDGMCPVVCAECPVADKVVSQKEAIATLLGAARVAFVTADEALTSNAMTLAKLEDQRKVFVDWERRLRDAMAATKALEADGTIPKVLGPEPESVGVDPDLEVLIRAETAAANALAAHETAVSDVEKYQAEVDRITKSRELLRIAMRILGKGGAQRRIATRNLEAIEKMANAVLDRAGVDLKVTIEYGRELQEVATICDCGTAFARSTKERVCATCGAARGKKRDEKLYIRTSSVSGATEDLAGVAIQMAAARWRRLATGGEWSVVALDEPFGALDAHNRLAMAKTLAALASDGFEQAFVVAHSSDVLEALPHRIRITGDGKWSRVEVVR